MVCIYVVMMMMMTIELLFNTHVILKNKNKYREKQEIVFTHNMRKYGIKVIKIPI